MKFSRYALFFTVFISTNAYSQQNGPTVISAGGQSSANNSIALEWTLGELATESVQSAHSLYTQGFHQPELVVEKISASIDNEYAGKIRVFPNPVSSVINIQLGFTPKTSILVTLLDARGRLLLKKEIPQNNRSLQMNVSAFAKGAYILKLNNPDASIFQSFKVLKGQ